MISGRSADVGESSIEEALVCALQRLGFKKEQNKILRAFVSGRHVFVALPTGYVLHSNCVLCLMVSERRQDQ